jgi:hypothetical protein
MNTYRLCRNKYGYYKIQKYCYWTILGFGKFWEFWRDIRGQQMYPRITPDVLRFKTKREASDRIKEIKRKEKVSNDDWTACKVVK